MSAPPSTPEQAAALLSAFAVEGRLLRLEPYSGGHINDSWLAVLGAPGGEQQFLLQRINRGVFHRPDQLIENMERVTGHVAARLQAEGAGDLDRRVLRLVRTRAGRPSQQDQGGETWRLVPWIEGTRCLERARSEREAFETALAFGRFLRHLQDLPGPRLHETIPAFHDTPGRLSAFERAVAADRVGRVREAQPEIEALLARGALARALADPAARGELRERPVHNDAKISNVLFDERSGEALCVIDLDTVMPGLALHDFGDLVRSGVSDSDEDERDLERVAVRVPFFAALVSGFAEGAGGALSPAERSLLVAGALAITYEQALRFLADHLDGDRYYRILHPGHNLQRTRAQIALVASLERERPRLERLL